MKCFVIFLATGSFITGLISAWYWYKASAVPVEPVWIKNDGIEPGDSLLSQSGWISGLLGSVHESARLNKVAAAWTAFTVVLTTISALVGVVWADNTCIG